MTYNKKVIDFPKEPVLWTFEDFVYPNGSDPIDEWYNGESEGVQNTFDSLLKDFRKTDQHLNWIGWRGYLKGEAKQWKIWEVGFKADGKQYRVFGIFGLRRKHAILLIGCHHKQKIYAPPDAMPTAIKRAKMLSEGVGRTYARPIRDDK